MGSEKERLKQEQYEGYIEHVSPMAAAVGRRVPYHLEYLRRHGAGPVPEGKAERGGCAGQQD